MLEEEDDELALVPLDLLEEDDDELALVPLDLVEDDEELPLLTVEVEPEGLTVFVFVLLLPEGFTRLLVVVEPLELETLPLDELRVEVLELLRLAELPA
ncbi:MAG: hypothetical protein SOZ66_04615, partial [Candidatus Cryptobacteroides sp.]|nr:hypothetical protein [Candidatus Cryptobacteroides sp.]